MFKVDVFEAYSLSPRNFKPNRLERSIHNCSQAINSQGQCATMAHGYTYTRHKHQHLQPKEHADAGRTIDLPPTTQISKLRVLQRAMHLENQEKERGQQNWVPTLQVFWLKGCFCLKSVAPSL
jgi:hypothetical protein